MKVEEPYSLCLLPCPSSFHQTSPLSLSSFCLFSALKANGTNLRLNTQTNSTLASRNRYLFIYCSITPTPPAPSHRIIVAETTLLLPHLTSFVDRLSWAVLTWDFSCACIQMVPGTEGFTGLDVQDDLLT